MISFKQYLSESKGAPLYHATFIHNAEKILADNALIGTIQDQGAAADLKKRVIFVTRSFRHAKTFYGGGSSMVIFELDRKKLNSRYRIRPIKNWSDRREGNHKPSYMTGKLGGNEFEEIIIADRITDIENYITAIHVATKVDKDKYPYLYNFEGLEFI